MSDELRYGRIIAALFLAIVIAVLAKVRSRRLLRQRGFPLPPGPKGWPIIGNLLQVPKDFSWLTFSQWGEEYGDIIHLAILNQPIIVLNSHQACKSLLDLQATVTSDRPVLQMGGKMTGWDQFLPFLHYGPRLRELRRLMKRSIGTRESLEKEGLGSIGEEGCRRFLGRVMEWGREGEGEGDGGGDVGMVIRKSIGAMLLKLTFGYEIQEEGEDHFIQLQEHLMDHATELTAPGAFLVDVIPFLRHLPSWFPGAGFKTKAKIYKQYLSNITQIPHQFVKEQMAAGRALPSMTSANLKDGLSDEEEYNVLWASAAIYGAGVDSTDATLRTFVLLMGLYPDVQRKAQAEMDAHLGSAFERLPTLEDRPHLPYLEAVIKEVLRWNAIAPLGVPHRISEDIVHEGHFLPKDALIFANIWQLLHDPKTYKRPAEFDPERFIRSAERPEPEQDPRNVCFGFGRRICPGLNLADASIFNFFAMTLAVFDIKHSGLGEGKSLSQLRKSVEFDSSIVCTPKPFKCTMIPRSSNAAELIRLANEHK